jgi:hypothetical protein
MLQKETSQSQNIVDAVSSIAQIAFAGQAIRDLQPQQAQALQALTALLEANRTTIAANENILLQMTNPTMGKSKQTLDPPAYVEAPPRHVRHYSVMQASTLKDNIVPFDPDDPHSDIVRTWDQMQKYGNKHYFTEDEYIEAWGKVTKGEAQHQLYNMIQSKYDLVQILQFWEELYSKQRSIIEQQEVIDSFQRKTREALTAVMLRVTVLIDQMEYAEDPHAWPGIRDKQRRDVLLRVITHHTFMFLKSRREAHERNGYLMKVDEMIQEAHNFEQAHGQVPQAPYPDKAQMPVTSATIIQAAAWNPQPPWNNKSTPMEVDNPGQTQRFMKPPPTVPTALASPQQQRGRSRDRFGKPYDNNRPKSPSPYRSNSQGPPSRSTSQTYRDNRRQSHSPNRNNNSNYNKDKNRNPNNRPSKEYGQQRSTSNSSDSRRGSQTDLSTVPTLAKNPISSEAGNKALTLNIGDQNQFFQCNAKTLCNKVHIWPKSSPLPDFCPDVSTQSKN